MPRFSVRDLFLLIASLGIALAAYRYLWMPPPNPNARPHLSVYLAILSLTTLGSFLAQPAWRRPCQGYALFAWLNLVLVMYGGFWLSDIYDAERVIHGARLGMSLGLLCALLTAWLLPEPPPGLNSAAADQRG
jgi:hypothetical protein